VYHLIDEVWLGDRDVRIWMLIAGVTAWNLGLYAVEASLPRDIAVAWLVFMILGEFVFGLGFLLMWRRQHENAEAVFKRMSRYEEKLTALIERDREAAREASNAIREEGREERAALESAVSGLRQDIAILQTNCAIRYGGKPPERK